MVDKFGERRRTGKRGPPGPPGDGLSSQFFSKRLATWLGDLVSFTFYFEDEKSGLVWKGGKAVAIKNRVGINDARALHKIPRLIKIPDYGYGLQFRKSIYEIKDVDVATGIHSKVVLIFAFKVDAYPRDRGTLFYSGEGERSVCLDHKNLVIIGSRGGGEVYVPFREHRWNLCWIEYNNADMSSRYVINDRKGTFVTGSETGLDDCLYIGGKKGEESYFQGVMARFDLISIPMDENECITDSFRRSFLIEHYDIEDGGRDGGGDGGHSPLADSVGDPRGEHIGGSDQVESGEDEVE